jgi:hypothetical protein
MIPHPVIRLLLPVIAVATATAAATATSTAAAAISAVVATMLVALIATVVAAAVVAAVLVALIAATATAAVVTPAMSAAISAVVTAAVTVMLAATIAAVIAITGGAGSVGPTVARCVDDHGLAGGLGSLVLDGDLGELESVLNGGEEGQRYGALYELGLSVELVVQPFKQLQDELAVLDGIVDVREGVSEGLDLAAVDADGHVALAERMELAPQMHAPAGLVGCEEVEHRLPRLVGGAVRLHDELLEVVGDRGNEPQRDGGVRVAPVVVGEMGVGLFLDMVASAVAREETQNGFAPLAEVLAGDVKLEGDEVGDVDVVDGGRRSRQGKSGVGGHGSRSGWVAHRRRHRGEEG